MKKQSYEIDMVNGPIFKNMILFVIPLILGNLLQLFYNAADLIVVSRWAGSSAMASVGATGSLSTVIINGSLGISIGASVLVSRRFGARDFDGVHKAVHSSMLLGLIAGCISAFVGIVFSRSLLLLMATPKGEVLDGAVLYMQIYFAGIPASMVYNFGAAILRAVGDTKRPLYILAASGFVNVVLNLILVIVFHMGVAGVAIATAVSNYLSAFVVVLVLARSEGSYKLIIKKIKLHKDDVVEILKVGLPAGLQSMMFALANTVIQSSVNSFGKACMAGNAAGANIEGFVYTAMNAFYQATLTLVGQNYGAKNEARIKKSMRTTILSVTVVGLVLGVLSVIFATQLLGIYITDSAEAIKYGIVRIAYTGLPYFLCGIMECLAGTLRGLGYSTYSAVNSLIGACGFRILWVNFVLPLHHSTEMLFLCWPLSWIVVIIMHLIVYLFVRKKAFAKMHQL